MHFTTLRRPAAWGIAATLSIVGLAACSSSTEAAGSPDSLQEALSASSTEQVATFETSIATDREDLQAFLEANTEATPDQEQLDRLLEGRLVSTFDNGEDQESREDDLASLEWSLGDTLLAEARSQKDTTYLRIEPEEVQEQFPGSREPLERLNSSLAFDDTGLASLQPLLEGEWVSVDTSEGSVLSQLRQERKQDGRGPQSDVSASPSPNVPTEKSESSTPPLPQGSEAPAPLDSASTPTSEASPSESVVIEDASAVSPAPSSTNSFSPDSDVSPRASSQPSTDTRQGNIQGVLETLLEEDATVTEGDKEGPGDHYTVSVPAEAIQARLQEAYPDLARRTADRQGSPSAAALPEGDVSVDLWVEDDLVSQMEIDLVQFAENQEGNMVVRTTRQDTQEVEIPQEASELDVAALKVAFQDFGNQGSRGGPAPSDEATGRPGPGPSDGAQFGGTALEAATYLEVALTTIAQLENQPASAEQLALIQENIPEGVTVERSGENLEVTDAEGNKACLIFSGEVGVTSEVRDGAC